MTTTLDRATLKNEVKKLIPEFDWIKDEELREKSVDVWCDAMEQGGWMPEDLDSMPFTLLLDPCPASFLTHTRSVTTVAYKAAETLNGFYAEKLPLNMDYLVAGAILHDVGKLLEYEKKNGRVVKSHSGKCLRHPFSGVGLGFARKLPHDILHMIATHAKEGDLGKRFPESVIIHHADFINFEPFH